MTTRKRGIMARLCGLKRDESTERFQKARVERAEREHADMDAEDAERDTELDEARKQTDETTETLGACTTSLSGVLKPSNGTSS